MVAGMTFQHFSQLMTKIKQQPVYSLLIFDFDLILQNDDAPLVETVTSLNLFNTETIHHDHTLNHTMLSS